MFQNLKLNKKKVKFSSDNMNKTMMNFNQYSSSSSSRSNPKEVNKDIQEENKSQVEENKEISWAERPISYFLSFNDKFIILFRGNHVSKEDMLLLLSQPIPEYIGNIQLIIKRKSSKFSKVFSKYYLYNTYKSIFLLNAKKQFGSSTSNYHITATKDCFDK